MIDDMDINVDIDDIHSHECWSKFLTVPVAVPEADPVEETNIRVIFDEMEPIFREGVSLEETVRLLVEKRKQRPDLLWVENALNNIVKCSPLALKCWYRLVDESDKRADTYKTMSKEEAEAKAEAEVTTETKFNEKEKTEKDSKDETENDEEDEAEHNEQREKEDEKGMGDNNEPSPAEIFYKRSHADILALEVCISEKLRAHQNEGKWVNHNKTDKDSFDLSFYEDDPIEKVDLLEKKSLKQLNEEARIAEAERKQKEKDLLAAIDSFMVELNDVSDDQVSQIFSAKVPSLGMSE
jgi:hypothetical protein